MRLFNHTKTNSDLLKKVILEAAKSIGIAPKTRYVPVKVIITSSWRVKGIAYKGREVTLAFMNGRNRRNRDYCTEAYTMIKANGFMVLSLPLLRHYGDALELAEIIFAVAAHEWRHIRDCQQGCRFDSHKVLYWDRCQEIRAKRSEKLAGINLHKSVNAQEAVLNLAINLEEVTKEVKRKYEEKWARRRKKQEDAWKKTPHGIKTVSILHEIMKERQG